MNLPKNDLLHIPRLKYKINIQGFYCRYRLVVRTSGFHPDDRGSIPRSGTKYPLKGFFILLEVIDHMFLPSTLKSTEKITLYIDLRGLSEKMIQAVL